MKKCYKCQQSLSFERFSKNKSKPDGLATECKDCKKTQDKLYSEKNVEKLKLNKQKYYLNNRDVIIEKSCKYAKDNPIRHNEKGKIAKEKNKFKVFSHYCQGDIKCQYCNQNDIDVLSIDHVNGDGAEHRKKINSKGGNNFHRWLKKNNFPDGFQILCFNCNFKKRNQELKPNNPTHLQNVRAAYARKIKLECLNAYGSLKCVCGQDDIDVLTLDHVNDDGEKHRKETGTRGYNFYHMLRKNNFPKDVPLQVLCMNCQIRKRQNKYNEERKSRQTNSSNDSAIII